MAFRTKRAYPQEDYNHLFTCGFDWFFPGHTANGVLMFFLNLYIPISSHYTFHRLLLNKIKYLELKILKLNLKGTNQYKMFILSLYTLLSIMF